MSVNPDGSATCDRCGAHLPGDGVIHGMLGTDLHNGAVRQFIWCYKNHCRTVALTGFLNYPRPRDSAPVCTEHGTPLAKRSVEVALLLTDIQPGGGIEVRNMQMCYADGSRDRFITANTRSLP